MVDCSSYHSVLLYTVFHEFHNCVLNTCHVSKSEPCDVVWIRSFSVELTVVICQWFELFSESIKADIFEFFRYPGLMWEYHASSQYENEIHASSFPVVLHGNNLLVFGGTGIPFGESNGNDVHVCNVKYKRWALLSCRGKKPSRIYGQVPIYGQSWWMNLFRFFSSRNNVRIYYHQLFKWKINPLLLFDFSVPVWNCESGCLPSSFRSFPPIFFFFLLNF